MTKAENLINLIESDKIRKDDLEEFVAQCKKKDSNDIIVSNKRIVVYKDEDWKKGTRLFDIHTYADNKNVDDALGVHADDLYDELYDIIHNKRKFSLIQ